MNNNTHIGCNVTECRHHSTTEDYCTLEHIDVVKNTAEADCEKCTDCSSFEKR